MNRITPAAPRCNQFWIIGLASLIVMTAGLPALGADADSIKALRQIGKAFASIAEKAKPAVVGIKAERVLSAEDLPQGMSPYGPLPYDDDLFNFFFGQPRQYQRQPRTPRRQQPSQVVRGSGFIISKDGYILTNNHVVTDAKDKQVSVKLASGDEVTGKVVGTDPESEVAVVKIDRDNLPCLELADSDAIEVGQWVVAIGNPFDLNQSVTAGIVSAKGRNLGLTNYDDMIQTDAAINPGNSGGPLLDLDAKVVGINTAIMGPGGNIGIGFAVPINMAKGIYEQLISTGEVTRGFLGVMPEDVTADIAKAQGIEVTKGAILSEVTPDSPADKADLKPYDVVVELNGRSVEDAQDFRRQVALMKPGSEVKIGLIRDGKHMTCTATLGKRNLKELAAAASPTDSLSGLGFQVGNLTQETAERFGYEKLSGVLITEVTPGSQADEENLKPGQLIIEVNRKPVKNTTEFYAAVDRAKDRGVVMLRVTDGRNKALATLKLKQP